MGIITPLFADIFNTSNLNINDKQLDNIIKFVSNQNYSKSGQFSGIEDISLISSDLYILLHFLSSLYNISTLFLSSSSSAFSISAIQHFTSLG